MSMPTCGGAASAERSLPLPKRGLANAGVGSSDLTRTSTTLRVGRRTVHSASKRARRSSTFEKACDDGRVPPSVLRDPRVARCRRRHGSRLDREELWPRPDDARDPRRRYSRGRTRFGPPPSCSTTSLTFHCSRPSLAARFGPPYREYKRQVRRFIPRLTPWSPQAPSP